MGSEFLGHHSHLMKKGKSPGISLGDVARKAGISRTAAGYALQNRPGVSSETRQRVMRIAKQLGYIPDARIGVWMARVRESKSKDLLPIAWLNTSHEEDAWRKYKFHTPFLEGARDRALQLGYRLEEFWVHQPGLTLRRLSQILYQRGIEGAIVTPPARHLRLNWNHLAGVALGGALLAPRLHRVGSDDNFNLLLVLKMLKRSGYRRIGICLMTFADRVSHHIFRAVANDYLAQTCREDRIPSLFYAHEDAEAQKKLALWLRRNRPEVIVCSSNKFISWIQGIGLRVPEDIGLVHLAIDDDVPDWAGIHSNRHSMGVAAAEQVAYLIQNRQFGVPRTPFALGIRGHWQHGSTLQAKPLPLTGKRALAAR